MKQPMRFVLFIFIITSLIILNLSTTIFANNDPELGANETTLGKEGASQVAKDYKIGKDSLELEKVRDIGNKLAAIANKTQIVSIYGSPKVTPFEYTFNIIEEKDINAFSLPGGYIYVYRGLLDYVQSDHELAGVIAHEIIHAAHHHMVYLLKKQDSMNNQMAILLLASMLSKTRGSDMSNIMMGAQLYQIAMLNGYGMQAERDSDYGAVLLMKEAGYNPVGLLTFMERLAKRPELFDLGIYRSHPLDSDRVKAAKAVIQDFGIPIKRRQTTNAITAKVVSPSENDKILNTEVMLNNVVIYMPASRPGKSADQIAQEVAKNINKYLDEDLSIYQLRVDTENATVIAKNTAIISVTPDDAALMGKTPAQVATGAANAIRNVLMKQIMDTIH